MRKGMLLNNYTKILGKPHISRMLENCILDDLQEIKFLEALVCGESWVQENSYEWEFSVQKNYEIFLYPKVQTNHTF